VKASATTKKVLKVLKASASENDVDPYAILPASPGQFPYVVGLKIRNNGASCSNMKTCTGVLYDYNFVLTAGI
jgi:hypothetical protein